MSHASSNANSSASRIIFSAISLARLAPAALTLAALAGCGGGAPEVGGYVLLEPETEAAPGTGRGSPPQAVADPTQVFTPAAPPPVPQPVARIEGDFTVDAFVFAGSPTDPSLGVSRAGLRAILLNSERADFWRAVSERAPGDFDRILSDLYVGKGSYLEVDQALRSLNVEFINYLVGLSVYAPLLTDTQRREIFEVHADAARAFRSDPTSCAIVAGFEHADLAQTRFERSGLSASQRSEINAAFGRTLSQTMARLVYASDATQQASTDGQLLDRLVDAMMNAEAAEGELATFLSGTEDNTLASCDAAIEFLSSVASSDGSAAERFRLERTQDLLRGKILREIALIRADGAQTEALLNQRRRGSGISAPSRPAAQNFEDLPPSSDGMSDDGAEDAPPGAGSVNGEASPQ